ncbi:hypothetical protein F4810DRAFT_646874 [Camillea tinctor]|nr:hypothetical protein F4810DRAFT_646874 [Camillea tinctor]
MPTLTLMLMYMFIPHAEAIEGLKSCNYEQQDPYLIGIRSLVLGRDHLGKSSTSPFSFRANTPCGIPVVGSQAKDVIGLDKCPWCPCYR